MSREQSSLYISPECGALGADLLYKVLTLTVHSQTCMLNTLYAAESGCANNSIGMHPDIGKRSRKAMA